LVRLETFAGGLVRLQGGEPIGCAWRGRRYDLAHQADANELAALDRVGVGVAGLEREEAALDEKTHAPLADERRRTERSRGDPGDSVEIGEVLVHERLRLRKDVADGAAPEDAIHVHLR